MSLFKRRYPGILNEFIILSDRIQKLENEIWELKNPTKFSRGDEVEYTSGATDYKYLRAKIIIINNVPRKGWKYTLWIYDWNKLHEFNDVGFYNPKYVKLRKYEAEV